MSHDICHVQTNFTIDITEFTSSRDGDRDVYHPNTLLDDDQISASSIICYPAKRRFNCRQSLWDVYLTLKEISDGKVLASSLAA